MNKITVQILVKTENNEKKIQVSEILLNDSF